VLKGLELVLPVLVLNVIVLGLQVLQLDFTILTLLLSHLKGNVDSLDISIKLASLLILFLLGYGKLLIKLSLLLVE